MNRSSVWAGLRMGVFAACLAAVSGSAAAEEETGATEPNGTRIVPLEPLPGDAAPEGQPANGSGSRHSGARVVPLEPLPAARKPAGDRAPTEEAAVAGMAPAESRESALTVLLSPRDSREVAVAVHRWAAAWSEQRVDDYLEFYARSFDPPAEMTREQWRSQRRSRVSGPRFVSVTLGSLAVGGDGVDSAWAEFVQSYRASGYSDTVIKRLDWAREDGAWRIVKENVVSVVAVH